MGASLPLLARAATRQRRGLRRTGSAPSTAGTRWVRRSARSSRCGCSSALSGFAGTIERRGRSEPALRGGRARLAVGRDVAAPIDAAEPPDAPRPPRALAARRDGRASRFGTGSRSTRSRASSPCPSRSSGSASSARSSSRTRSPSPPCSRSTSLGVGGGALVGRALARGALPARGRVSSASRPAVAALRRALPRPPGFGARPPGPAPRRCGSYLGDDEPPLDVAAARARLAALRAHGGASRPLSRATWPSCSCRSTCLVPAVPDRPARPCSWA